MKRRSMVVTETVSALALGGLFALSTTWLAMALPLWAALCLATTAFAGIVAAIRGSDRARVSRPLDRVRRQLGGAIARIAEMETIDAVQRRLDDNLSRLRQIVYDFGDPRLVDGVLMFGNQPVGGDDSIVDRVQAEFGGVAAIFRGDIPVSTNARDAEGRRITRAMHKGPAHDALFRAGTSYRGEVVIQEEPHIAIYEPIIVGTTVAGALFVAMRTQDALRLGPKTEPDGAGDWLAAMPDVIRSLESTIASRHAATRDANVHRSAALDAQRKILALQREQAIRQKAETQLMHGNTTSLVEDLHALSKRTERQAATLEETTASLAFVTNAVRETAASVGIANLIAIDARSEADCSGEVVHQTIAAMRRINTSSLEIEQIVGVIDQIAMQTNLLALNAAIEAARAGDAGRGFAVVASEVRALAQRSAGAANAVKQLVRASSAHVADGVALVDSTEKALGVIATKIHRLNEIMDSLAHSIKDQASSLEDIYVAVNDLDKVTQQNAAMVEHSMAATERVATQSDTIRRLAHTS